jgi:outer membrane protein assembly factor BamB
MVYIANLGGNVYAVDRLTGQERWKFKAPGYIFSTPTIVDEVLYVGHWGKERLYAIDRQTGQELWQFQAGGPVNGSPVVDENVVYFLCTDGCLYAVRI